MIKFAADSPNQLLVNPKLSQSEKNILNELKQEFEIKFGGCGYFLIASSGSSQKNSASVKLIALRVEKVLNSALRFNDFFQAGDQDHWGLVLPGFHVAGLGVRARAFLSAAKVFVRAWEPDQLELWVTENQIRYISMVPTQIFDLVQKKIKAPAALKKVFVGASTLSEDLRKQAIVLNWPLIETYGMTETSSMIAVKDAELFQILPGVDVKTYEELLSVKCNSLLTAAIHKQDEKIEIKTFAEKSWFQTQDRVELIHNGETVYLKFLGRAGDFIKILGEGVSLMELRNQLAKLISVNKLEIPNYELLAFDDARAGSKLVLVVENPVNKVRGGELIGLFNGLCRPYERIQHCIVVGQIPRTDLGKLKAEEIKRIIREELNKGTNG